ncbi:MAG: hypothetical protein ACI9K5_004158, partial [Gammaproteobacteria bacterium]
KHAKHRPTLRQSHGTSCIVCDRSNNSPYALKWLQPDQSPVITAAVIRRKDPIRELSAARGIWVPPGTAMAQYRAAQLAAFVIDCYCAAPFSIPTFRDIHRALIARGQSSAAALATKVSGIVSFLDTRTACTDDALVTASRDTACPFAHLPTRSSAMLE